MLKQGFENRVINFVRVTSTLCKRALDEVSVHKQAQKKAAAVAKPLLDRLVSSGLIKATEKSAAAAMLGSHAETLALLDNAVDLLAAQATQKQASAAGEAVSEKDAGVAQNRPEYDSLNSPFVGRRTSEKKASDFALAKVLS